MPSKPLSKLPTSTRYVPVTGATTSPICGRSQSGGRAECGAVRRPQANPRPEVVRVGDLADVHRDPFAGGGRERPDVEVALENLAGMHARRW